jgi:hypothetical protein
MSHQHWASEAPFEMVSRLGAFPLCVCVCVCVCVCACMLCVCVLCVCVCVHILLYFGSDR